MFGKCYLQQVISKLSLCGTLFFSPYIIYRRNHSYTSKGLTFINPFSKVLEVLFVGEPSFFKFSVFSLVYFLQEPYGIPPPGPYTPRPCIPPAQSMLGDTVNARAVRIPLECNLVQMKFVNFHIDPPYGTVFTLHGTGTGTGTKWKT